MPSWSTPIVPSTDFHDVALLAMLAAAVNERTLFGTGNPGTTPTPAAGDAYLAADYWSSGTGIQRNLAAIISAGVYIDHRITIEANTDPTLFSYNPASAPAVNKAYWTLSALRTAAGLPTTLYYSWDGTTQTHDATKDNTLFRRQRPREILSTTATTDVQGNPAIAGQLAYLMGDDPGFPGNAYKGVGMLYKCHASGDWRREVVGPADTLDNTLASPNTLAENNTVLGNAPILAGNFYGGVQVGDTMRSHVPEEIRLITDLLRNVAIDSTTAAAYSHNLPTSAPFVGGAAALWASSYNQNISAVGTDPSAATAESNAAAGWPTNSTPGGGACTLPFANYQLSYNGTNYTALAERADVTAEIDYNPAVTQKHRAVWYAYTDLISSGGNAGLPLIFDANGDAVLSGKWHSWYTGPDGNPASETAPKLGDGLTLPDAPPAPASGAQNNQGYSVEEMVVVLIGNVAGGFQYCTVTV